MIAVIGAWTLPFFFGVFARWTLASCVLLWFALFFPGLWMVLRGAGRNPFTEGDDEAEAVPPGKE